MGLVDRLNPDSENESQSFLSNTALGGLEIAGQDASWVKALREEVSETLIRDAGADIKSGRLLGKSLQNRVMEIVGKKLDERKVPLTEAERQKIVQLIIDELLGNGPIEPFLRDPDVTEVMVNGYKNIYIERKGKITKTEVQFESEEHLRDVIERICTRVGRRIDESSPMVDARLLNGSRVNAVIPPIAIDGSSLTIRKFSVEPLTYQDLLTFGTFDQPTLEFLQACVQAKLNIVISGGTGSGKTTTLNVLSSFIGSDERIVTIEDSAELQLKKEHVIRLESRPANIEGKGIVSIRDLVRNALRMRPDRIVVGEVRDEAALDMLQAMNTGHEGSLTTVHANSPREAITRIETMVLMAGIEFPMRAVREQIHQSIDLIIQQSRVRDGSRKITSIVEVTGIDGDTIQIQELFKFNYSQDSESQTVGTLQPTGIIPTFEDKFVARKVQLDRRVFLPR